MPQAQEAAVSKFDELALQHRALHSLSASQVALAESLGEQLSKARGDARSATRSQDDASVLVVAERERHVATTQALSAAQLEVERMQAKLKWRALACVPPPPARRDALSALLPPRQAARARATPPDAT